MKATLFALFLVVAVVINAVTTDTTKKLDLLDGAWKHSHSLHHREKKSRVSSDSQPLPPIDRKKRGINKEYKKQHFYRCDRSRYSCNLYLSESSSPGHMDYYTKQACEDACRKGRV